MRMHKRLVSPTTTATAELCRPIDFLMSSMNSTIMRNPQISQNRDRRTENVGIIGLVIFLVGAIAISSYAQATEDNRLISAVRNGDVAVVASLLRHGANPNARENPYGDTVLSRILHKVILRDPSGSSTVLILATMENNAPIVNALLAHGADPHRTDEYCRRAIDLVKDTDADEALVFEVLKAAAQ